MRLTFVPLLLALLPAPAAAQAVYPFVVSSCGGQSFTVGQSKPITMDTAGNLCTVSGGAGVATTVNQGGTWTVQPGNTANTTPWLMNVTQFGSNNIATGTGASGSGIPRVTISNDSTLAANQSVNLSQINSQTAANGGVTGSLLAETGCAGQTVANTLTAAINNAASSSNLKIITKASAKKIYICGINIGPTASAVNVALVSGTLTTNQCDTSTTGLAGGATAATGWQFAANGGLTMGNGVGLVAGPAATNTDVCLLFSGAVQVSGVVTYAQF